MKKLFFILTLILLAPSCNRTEPQEQQFNEDIQEMNEEKTKDPRMFDKEQEQEQDMREVKREPGSMTQDELDKIIWTPANN